MQGKLPFDQSVLVLVGYEEHKLNSSTLLLYWYFIFLYIYLYIHTLFETHAYFDF